MSMPITAAMLRSLLLERHLGPGKQADKGACGDEEQDSRSS
jgi:hypothetical protein